MNIKMSKQNQKKVEAYIAKLKTEKEKKEKQNEKLVNQSPK